MVAALNGAGLRVVMDVVYNHTTASGQDRQERARPDRARLLPPAVATGAVETSTCCANTATEHRDDGEADGRLRRHVGTRVQGRRLPLRPDGPPLAGQHARRARGARRADARARRRRRARASTSTARAGTSARWPTTPASRRPRQVKLAGTGIGTFTDRLRDAVRGGGPFDEDPRIQGFASGLFTDPNGAAVNGDADEQRARLLLYHDQIKVGLAGNLRDYELRRPHGSRGHRRRGGLQRAAGRLRRRPVGDGHLRRRPRQRDAVRRAAATSCRPRRRWPTGCG